KVTRPEINVIVSGHVDFARAKRYPRHLVCKRNKSNRRRTISRPCSDFYWNPEPTVVHERPSTIVIRRPAPRFRRNPRRTPYIGQVPVARTERRPARAHTRRPAITVVAYINPIAVVVQVVDSGHISRNVVTAQGRS